MQSLAHNIYHSSLKFIIFLSVRTILVFREDRSKYTVFTNKDTLNGDTTNFLFNRPVGFFVVDFFLLCSSTKDDDYDKSKFQQHISLEDLYC